MFALFSKEDDSPEQRRAAALNLQARHVLETKNYTVIEAEIPESIY